MRTLLTVLLLSLPALADWEGKVQFTFTPPRPGTGPASQGTIHMKHGKVRIEQPGPRGNMAVLFDFKTRKLAMLMLDQKQYMEMDRSMQAATLPPVCDSGKIDACLSAEGFKKSGSEKVNGYAASIWENDRETPMGKIHQKIWVADGKKELVLLRQQTQSDRGATETNVTELKETPQPDSLFEIPKDFTKLEGPPGGMRGGPGGPPGRPPH